MTISNSLPGILRWFEVIQTTIEEVPPVRFACETMEAKNAELRQLISLYKSDPKRSIHPLSMRLQVNIYYISLRYKPYLNLATVCVEDCTLG